MNLEMFFLHACLNLNAIAVGIHSFCAGETAVNIVVCVHALMCVNKMVELSSPCPVSEERARVGRDTRVPVKFPVQV